MNKRLWNVLVGLGTAALLGILLASCQQGIRFSRSYSSNGERIYFTASNERGERITYSGGPPMGGRGMMMMGSDLTCSSCHGQDARGGIHIMMMQVMDAPDMRYVALAGLDTFRNAVVDGKRPNGDRLSNDMPRWNINDDDLADLAAFLKSPEMMKEKESGLFPGGFIQGGWWIIFPSIGLILILMMMRRIGFLGSRRRPRDSGGTETALEILKKRYAKGDISKQEYEQMKGVL